MKNEQLAQLIEVAAAQFDGNKSELARHIGETPQRLYQWEMGTRPCPVEKVALIAAAANLPADQWLTRAVLWKHEGTETGERLKSALGKLVRATGAALVLCIAVALFGTGQTANQGLFAGP